MTTVQAYNIALAADAAWSAELRKAFGKHAGDVRYTSRGEGSPGTPLNNAYLVFRRTNDAWLAKTKESRP